MAISFSDRPMHMQAAMHHLDAAIAAHIPCLFVVDYLGQEAYIIPLSQLDPTRVRFSIPGMSFPDTPAPPPCTNFEWRVIPPTFEAYQCAFDTIMQGLQRGDSYLANLTCRSVLHSNLTLLQMYHTFHAPYKLYWHDQLLVCSPEPFVHIAAGRISTYPMKGTIAATVPHAAQHLLHDPKEAAEHATIVDLLRNDLSRVAHGVHVPRYRYVETLHATQGDILQTSSEITGTLASPYDQRWGSALLQLLPAGSITGAPKVKTQALIAQAEHTPRGFYTGIFGVYDGTRLHSAVMIRCVQQAGQQRYFHSGGGITAQSIVQDEYQELILKTHAPLP